MEGLLTREEAARFLAKPTSWLRYAEQHRLIPFVRVGSHIRYRRGDLEDWLEKNRVLPIDPSSGASASKRGNR